jgi:hypothetical protein
VRKSAYFASRPSAGWPHPNELERYFLAPSGQRWFFETENDSANFTAEGVDETELELPPFNRTQGYCD